MSRLRRHREGTGAPASQTGPLTRRTTYVTSICSHRGPPLVWILVDWTSIGSLSSATISSFFENHPSRFARVINCSNVSRGMPLIAMSTVPEAFGADSDTFDVSDFKKNDCR
jgi:hypothetical protein